MGEVFIHYNDERLTQPVWVDKIDGLKATSKLKKKEGRSENWEDKVLHGQYLRQTKEIRREAVTVGALLKKVTKRSHILACNFIKIEALAQVFQVNFGTFLRTPFLKNICERLLL